MTSKDKAQEKLIASIRKTKQGAIDKKAGVAPKAKSTSKSIAKPKVKKKPKRTLIKKVLPQDNSVNYQSVKRVWPD